MSKLYTADRFVTIGGTTAQYVTGTGSLVTFPAIPSGADYIQNQIASAQSANMWISGNALINGFVGIGTSNPNEKLEVVGKLRVSNGGSSAYYAELAGLYSPSPGYLAFRGGGGSGMVISSENYGSDTAIWSNNTEKIRINNSGNVGIGTTTPNNKLSVAGNVELVYGTGSKIGFNVNDSFTAYSTSIAYYGMSYGSNGEPVALSGYFGLGFFTAGAERMRINGSGNVGIGTSSPSRKLTIYDDLNDYQFRVGYSSSFYYDMGRISSSGLFSFYGNQSGYIGYIFGGADGEFMRINAAGNVGIGTSSPGSKLTVIGDIATSTRLASDTINGYTGGSTPLTIQTGGAQNVIIGTNNTERMRITSDGNVGIGTTSPGTKLHVDGANYSFIAGYDSGNRRVYIGLNSAGEPSIQATLSNGNERQLSINPSGGNVGIGTTSPLRKLEVASDGSNWISGTFSGTGNTDKVVIGNLAGAAIGSHNSALNAWSDFTVAGTDIKFSPYGSEAMRVAASGNVGIGTTSPSARLDIVSTATGSEGLRVDGAAGGFAFVVRGGGDYTSHIRAGATIGVNYFTTPPSNGLIVEGNVGIGTTSPGAKLDVNGDALINQLTIGQGPVVGQGNTALGKGALGSMVGGKANIAVGSNANSDNDVTGLTVIGVDLNVNPAGSALTQNSLVIGQYNNLNYSTQYPHIYAPDKVNCPNGNTTTDIIAVDYSIYTAIFMEYSIFNSDGDEFRAGTYTAAFKGTGTVVEDDNQTVVYSGTTLAATFTTSVTGSIVTIQLRNQDSDTYDIRVTARLLMR